MNGTTTTQPECLLGCVQDHSSDTDCMVPVGTVPTTNKGPITVTDYVTVGPGRVLRGLLRQNLGGRVRVHPAADLDDVLRFVERGSA